MTDDEWYPLWTFVSLKVDSMGRFRAQVSIRLTNNAHPEQIQDEFAPTVCEFFFLSRVESSKRRLLFMYAWGILKRIALSFGALAS